MNYVARQPGRSLRANLDFLDDPRYMGPCPSLKGIQFFNFDFLLGEMAESLLPFDFDTFWASGQRLWAVAADCRTGRALFTKSMPSGRIFHRRARQRQHAAAGQHG